MALGKQEMEKMQVGYQAFGRISAEIASV